MRSLDRRCWVVLVALSLSACGGQLAPEAEAPAGEAAPASAPEAAPEAAPPLPPPPARAPTGSALDAAEEGDDLQQAERDLNEANATLEQLGARAPSGASPMKHRGAADCDTTCKAYASLLRARAAICRIDGDEGERCARANEIVANHEESRASCGCTVE